MLEKKENITDNERLKTKEKLLLTNNLYSYELFWVFEFNFGQKITPLRLWIINFIRILCSKKLFVNFELMYWIYITNE